MGLLARTRPADGAGNQLPGLVRWYLVLALPHHRTLYVSRRGRRLRCSMTRWAAAGSRAER